MGNSSCGGGHPGPGGGVGIACVIPEVFGLVQRAGTDHFVLDVVQKEAGGDRRLSRLLALEVGFSLFEEGGHRLGQIL